MEQLDRSFRKLTYLEAAKGGDSGADGGSGAAEGCSGAAEGVAKKHLKWKALPIVRNKTKYKCVDCRGTYVLPSVYSVQKEGHMIMYADDYDMYKDLSNSGARIEVHKFPNYFNPEDLVLTTDAAYSERRGMCFGVVVRTSKLELIRNASLPISLSERVKCDSAVNAEARALCYGIELAVQEARKNPTIKKLYCYVDCKLVALSFNTGQIKCTGLGFDNTVNLRYINQCRKAAGLRPWKSENQLKEQEVQGIGIEIEVNHLPRVGNYAAHHSCQNRLERDQVDPIKGDVMRVLREDPYLTRYYKPKSGN